MDKYNYMNFKEENTYQLEKHSAVRKAIRGADLSKHSTTQKYIRITTSVQS